MNWCNARRAVAVCIESCGGPTKRSVDRRGDVAKWNTARRNGFGDDTVSIDRGTKGVALDVSANTYSVRKC